MVEIDKLRVSLSRLIQELREADVIDTTEISPPPVPQ